LKSKLLYSYAFFLAVYSAFVLLPKPDPVTLHQYHLSPTGLRLIDLTIIIILAGTWFAGFYGYAKLQKYTELIRGTKDGEQVAKLAKGMFILVMWLPVSSVSSAILNYVALKHVSWLPAIKVIENYINLLLPLVGFIFICLGARGLSNLVRQCPSFLTSNILIILLIYIGLIYFRLVATTHHRASVYHESIWLILTTLVAPYLYMWYLGALATVYLYLYQAKVAGVVYRKSWRLLAIGLGWLIVTSIGFQYLTTLTARLANLSIYWLLVIVYSALLVLSVGFVLIALGTKKLQKIEEA
jgi:hypothetical protein